MTINPVSQNLERRFKDVVEQTNEYSFFLFLSDYINYVLSVPVLVTIINAVMKKRDDEYEKVAQLEEATIKELRQNKKKLLKIIENNKVGPDSLTHITTISSGVSESESVLKTLELIESGGLHVGNFHSDALEHYLWDITVSLSRQNPSWVKEFIVANKPSNNTYSEYFFHLSDTIDKRREEVKRIGQAAKLELWGAFDRLLNFQKASIEARNNTNFMEVLKKYGNQSRNYLESQGAANITHYSEEIKKLINMKYSRTLDSTIYYLKVVDFTSDVKRINSYILEELSKQDLPTHQSLSLKSICLVTPSIAINNSIFLVLDDRFEAPIRFTAKNQSGEETAIKKLHDIAYFVDAPGKKVYYNKRLADNINNGLFKNKRINQYLKTNKYNKPTLVQKSENNTLVLKNEIPVKTMLVNAIPSQSQSLYIDKTR